MTGARRAAALYVLMVAAAVAQDGDALIAASRAARARAASLLPSEPAPAAAPPNLTAVDLAADFDTGGRLDAVDLADGGFEPGSSIRRMVLLPGLLTPEEAQTLIDLSRDPKSVTESHDSAYVGGHGEKAPEQEDGTEFRISMSRFLSHRLDRDHPVVSRVVGRIHAFANVPMCHGEELQVTEYRGARRDRYIPHLDSGLGIARSVTALVYLRTLRPGDGGGTVFVDTRLSERGAASVEAARRRALELAGEESDESFLRGREADLRASADRGGSGVGADDAPPMRELHEVCEADTAAAWAGRAAPGGGDGVGMSGTGPGRRLLVRPAVGLAVVWWNFDEQGRLDGRTRHAACELEPHGEGGEPRVRKMVAQRWMTWHAQQQAGPQGIQDRPSPNVLAQTLQECVTPEALRRGGVRVPKAAHEDLAELAWMLPSNWTSHEFLP